MAALQLKCVFYKFLFYVCAAVRFLSPGAQACIDTACLLCLPSPQCKLQQTGVTLNASLLAICSQ